MKLNGVHGSQATNGANQSHDSYARVVDRLLNSPQYGERWARHFMDIWRYCDWYGLGEQLRYSQKHIWHWRDLDRRIPQRRPPLRRDDPSHARSG